MGSTVTTPWTLRAGPPNQRDTVPHGAAPCQAHEMLGVAILGPRAFEGSVSCAGSRVSPSSFPARCTRPAGGARVLRTGNPGGRLGSHALCCLTLSVLELSEFFFFWSEFIYLENVG